jgi:hypothetical protein
VSDICIISFNGIGSICAETEAEDLIQRLYSKEPEISQQAHDDLSVTFKHAEDILADQYQSGKVFQTHSDRLYPARSGP